MLTVQVCFTVTLPSVKLRDAGTGSGVPSAATDRTSNVCAPRERLYPVSGLVHGANCRASNRHSKVGLPIGLSNVNVGRVPVRPLGPDRIRVPSNDVPAGGGGWRSGFAAEPVLRTTAQLSKLLAQ